MKTLLIIIALSLPLQTAPATPFEWHEFRQRIALAQSAGDVEALETLKSELEAREPEPLQWRHYWRGLIAFRAGTLAWPDGDAKRLFEACIEAAQAAIDTGEESGESRGLLGGCYGQLARGGALAGMRYGSKASAETDVALLDAPDNPRVLIFAGIRDLYTPIMFGGDPERAARRLERARQILESSGSGHDDPWRPRWGRVDAYGHLALALNELARPDDARDALEAARAAGIESDWLDGIRHQLGPGSGSSG